MKLYFEDCFISDIGGLEFQVYMVLKVTSFSDFLRCRERRARVCVCVCVCVCVGVAAVCGRKGLL